NKSTFGYVFGLSSLVVAFGCSSDQSSGPAQACFQGSNTGELVCKAGLALSQFTSSEPSTTPTQGEVDVDEDGKADAFLCVSDDEDDDGTADVEEEQSGEANSDDGEHEDDGVDEALRCETLKERGAVDGDHDQDGVADSQDSDDDDDGVADDR